MKFPWTEELCQQCGACCYVAHGVPVPNLEEVADHLNTTADFLLRVEAVEVAQDRPGSLPVLNTRSHGRCAFLSRTEGKHSCEIQGVKPPTCKTFRCWLLGSVEEYANLDGDGLHSNPFFGLEEAAVKERAFSFIAAMRASMAWDWWWSGNTDAITPAAMAAMNSVKDFSAIAQV